MIRTLADPYLAQNAGRRYPFADDTAVAPDNDSGILDLRISVWGVTAGQRPTATLTNVSTETVSGISCRRLTVSLAAGTVSLGTLAFDVRADIAENAPCVVRATSTGAVGEMTVTAAVLTGQTGATNLPFAASTVVAASLGVDSLQAAASVDDSGVTPTTLISGSGSTTAYPGAVVLVSGFNADPYIDGQHLRLDVAKGNGIREFCQTAATGQTCDNVLFTINGEKPGSDGELRLVGENGITVEPDPADAHALIVRLDGAAADRMSKPCGTSC